MSDGPVLGIDLGTTNSVVAVADGGQARVLMDAEGRRMVPSVVSFHPDGHTLVGYEARERRLVDAANTVYAVKRLIGRPFAAPEVARARERFAFPIVQSKHGGSIVQVRRGKYALAEISAMVLRELRRVAEARLDEACERAVITVPANFNELQRSATKAAGKVAGLEVLRILNEPTAAALAYGYGQASGSEKVAVYDLGGGTFDITILELDGDVFEVLATAGDTFLGGEDLDRAVAEHMSAAFLKEHGWDPREDHQAFERLKAAGEWTKCQLSRELAVELTVEELTHGKGGRALDLRFGMTRLELEELARPWLERSFRVCDEALQAAELKATDVDSVVLVGGSTRMPLCRQLVRSYFDREPRTDIDPDMVVAQGAAIHGYALGGPRPPLPPARVPAPPGKQNLERAAPPGAEKSQNPRRLPPLPRNPTPAAHTRTHTMIGVPQQPAFAPPEPPAPPEPAARPMRPTHPPPPVPELPQPSRPPGPPVVSSRIVEVETPKTAFELELDALAPPGGTSDALDDLSPPRHEAPFDPFADLVPNDPFAEPELGGANTASSSATEGAPPLNPSLERQDGAATRNAPTPSFGAVPPPPGRKMVPSREPTMPFSLERVSPAHHAPSPEHLPLPIPPDRPAPPERRISVVPMPERPPPVLMDVTPHSLGIETAGGYTRRLITKNSPVPAEQTRSFTTAQDDQREVAVRICQGEHDTFQDNEVLGEVVLDELPPMPRGALNIAVTFILDPDGTLAVEARDPASGRGQRTRINLRGGWSEAEIAAMQRRLESEELST